MENKMKKLLLGLTLLASMSSFADTAVTENQIILGTDCYSYNLKELVPTVIVDGYEEPFLRYGKGYAEEGEEVYFIWVGYGAARTNIAYCKSLKVVDKPTQTKSLEISLKKKACKEATSSLSTDRRLCMALSYDKDLTVEEISECDTNSGFYSPFSACLKIASTY